MPLSVLRYNLQNSFLYNSYHFPIVNIVFHPEKKPFLSVCFRYVWTELEKCCIIFQFIKIFIMILFFEPSTVITINLNIFIFILLVVVHTVWCFQRQTFSNQTTIVKMMLVKPVYAFWRIAPMQSSLNVLYHFHSFLVLNAFSRRHT